MFLLPLAVATFLGFPASHGSSWLYSVVVVMPVAVSVSVIVSKYRFFLSSGNPMYIFPLV